jgi:hypothetical protein
MGASNIDMVLDGKLTKRQVLDKIDEQRKFDKSHNGHQDGYSGDWQTIPDVKFHDHKVFLDIDEASNYCLDNAEKWSHAIAVKIKEANIEKLKENKKYKALMEKINVAAKEIKAAEDAPLIFKGKFITCHECKSKLATEFMKNWYSCKLCQQNLRPVKLLDKIAKLNEKLTKLVAQRDELANIEAEKGEVKWYISGWAAE